MKKPRPTQAIGCKRTTLGWAFLALGVLVAGVWAASAWWMVLYSTSRATWGISAGLFGVVTPRDTPLGWSTHWTGDTPQMNWRAKPGPANSNDTGWDGVIVGRLTYGAQFIGLVDTWCVSFWPIPLLLWTPAALLLRSGIIARRRAMTGTCIKCGYNVAGLTPDAPCPECGKTRHEHEERQAHEDHKSSDP